MRSLPYLYSSLLCFLVACMCSAMADGQVVVVDNGKVVTLGRAPHAVQKALGNVSAAPASSSPRAWPMALNGQSVPGGGTLDMIAKGFSANVNDLGQIAFFCDVEGSLRNQGIFVSDGTDLKAVVMGCGGYGGSGVPGSGVGDPSPMGGTFSGLWVGTAFTPSFNNRGDLLFVSDVDGGSAPRGLFIYQAATDDIAKVVAIGDAYPGGGVFNMISSGCINDHGEVVFVGGRVGIQYGDCFRWKAGVLTPVVAEGDPVPGGGAFTKINTDLTTLKDGTKMVLGPIPSINEHGQIAFRSLVVGGQSDVGIFVSTNGVHEWYVKGGDTTPVGGEYFWFEAPLLNNQGDIAFFGDFTISPGVSSAGWFVGSPGRWRKAIAFSDTYDGGICKGLAISSNPLTPLDDFGNCLVWTWIKMPNGDYVDHLLFCAANGTVRTLAKKGDATPLGGTYGDMQGFVSINMNGLCTLSASTPGVPGVSDAYFLAQAELSLETDTYVISASAGGTAHLQLDGGAGNANRNYFILGSASGIDPGLPLPGGMVTLPLNYDLLTELMISKVNSGALVNFDGLLDGAGTAFAQLHAIRPIPPEVVGMRLNLAYLLYDPVNYYPYDYVSNAVVITFVP